MSGARIIDIVPDQWGALTHQPPVLLFPSNYTHDLCLDSAGTGPVTRAPRVVEISVPWFAIRLIPIHHPVSMNVGGTINEFAPVWTSDSDILDINRHVHTRVDGVPAFGYVL